MSKPSLPRQLKDNEAMAVVRNLRTSPQKLNLVAALIRGKHVDKARSDLLLNSRRISNDVRKALESAIANAENNHQLDVNNLYVAECSVGTAMVMKRFHARARGRGAKIIKPFAHLRVVVREAQGDK
ncbi:MAG: 50S ribosomal protein L22 [Alphaproteobacteria bacterium]|nr:50S ribosomal protein L22 [Alphaproteobacteria bacterium]